MTAGARVTITGADDLATLLRTVGELAALADSLAALPNPWAPPALLGSVREAAADVRAQASGLRQATVRMKVTG